MDGSTIAHKNDTLGVTLHSYGRLAGKHISSSKSHLKRLFFGRLAAKAK